MATLCLLAEDGAMAQRWELSEQPLAVGRDESADIKINDASLSRRHFEIVREGESYLLKDLKSQNGTSVDGKRVQAAKLRHHDCIVAGRTLFLFSEQHASAKTNPKAKIPANNLPLVADP
jgi:pSer/pThr/pTyr-binding forkhead associated (FHA) protein